LLKAGKIKALAISGAERIPALPEVPTMTEFGATLDPNGVIGNSWHGVFTPTGTPDDIVARLSSEIIKIVKTQEVQDRLRSLGLTPTGMPGTTLTADVATDHAYWGKLIRDLGVKVE
jgi:tripartite-type tricarboxylate transporter receptor subunit TctC